MAVDHGFDAGAPVSHSWPQPLALGQQHQELVPTLRPGTKIQGKSDLAFAGNEQAQQGSPNAPVEAATAAEATQKRRCRCRGPLQQFGQRL
jgi:hypothetical protein